MVITEVGLEEVETYVVRRQNTVVQYIVTSTILELCLAEEQRPGARVTRNWWDQTVINSGQESVREAERTWGLEAERERENESEMAVAERQVAAE